MNDEIWALDFVLRMPANQPPQYALFSEADTGWKMDRVSQSMTWPEWENPNQIGEFRLADRGQTRFPKRNEWKP